jgi:succinylglutamate desuccinylase
MAQRFSEFKLAAQENERLRKENDELLRHIFRLGFQLFMQTESYRKMEQKRNKKCFNSEERQQLHTDIHNTFTKLIQIILENCPKATKEDIIFCCLSKLGLDSAVICCCMGNVNKQTANQRKYRIHMKMKEVKCEDLFDSIFKNSL